MKLWRQEVNTMMRKMTCKQHSGWEEHTLSSIYTQLELPADEGSWESQSLFWELPLEGVVLTCRRKKFDILCRFAKDDNIHLFYSEMHFILSKVLTEKNVKEMIEIKDLTRLIDQKLIFYVKYYRKLSNQGEKSVIFVQF